MKLKKPESDLGNIKPKPVDEPTPKTNQLVKRPPYRDKHQVKNAGEKIRHRNHCHFGF